MKSTATLSIVIPTRNRADQLKQTLDSVLIQVDPKWAEVVIVDNGSTDDTPEVSAAFSKSFKGRSCIHVESTPGLLAGRHAGAALAKGDVISFLDDDVDLSSEWQDSILNSFNDSSVHLVGGPSIPEFEATPPAWLNEFWQKSPCGGRLMPELSLIELGIKVPIDIESTMVWGLNYSIRSETLQKVGGFNPDCVPSELQHFQGDGETGLSSKIHIAGLRSIYHPGASVVHRIGANRFTPSYFESRYFYQGVCNSYTKLRFELLDSVASSFSQNRKMSPLRFAQKLVSRVKILAKKANQQSNLRKKFLRAMVRGFEFHQECARRSKQLRKWISQSDYFDFEYPQLEGSFELPNKMVHEITETLNSGETGEH